MLVCNLISQTVKVISGQNTIHQNTSESLIVHGTYYFMMEEEMEKMRMKEQGRQKFAKWTFSQ